MSLFDPSKLFVPDDVRLDWPPLTGTFGCCEYEAVVAIFVRYAQIKQSNFFVKASLNDLKREITHHGNRSWGELSRIQQIERMLSDDINSIGFVSDLASATTAGWLVSVTDEVRLYRLSEAAVKKLRGKVRL